MNPPSVIHFPGDRCVAYHLTEGALPGVIFLGGFKSDMNGSKALAVESFCRERGQRFLRFDYTGHGQSSGDFRHGTIGAWKQDALDIVDALGAETNILIGSSMGAWLSMLVALSRKEKIAALIGIASAPDFTERMIWQHMTPQQKQQLEIEGVFYATSCYGEAPYPITRMLIEESRNHLLLHAPINIDIPVHLLHGTQDRDVPWHVSVSLMDRLMTSDATLQLIKNGDHRLSSPEHLHRLCKTLENVLNQ